MKSTVKDHLISGGKPPNRGLFVENWSANAAQFSTQNDRGEYNRGKAPVTVGSESSNRIQTGQRLEKSLSRACPA